jgi:hypothetical protein
VTVSTRCWISKLSAMFQFHNPKKWTNAGQCQSQSDQILKSNAGLDSGKHEETHWWQTQQQCNLQLQTFFGYASCKLSSSD